MRRNTSVTLGDHFMHFIGRQVAAGRYGSGSEVVCAGLRLPEKQETKLKALLAALIEGEESRPPQPFDFEEFLAEMRVKYAGRPDCGAKS